MKSGLQDCLLLEAIVWLSCTHLYLLRDYSPDFPSSWSCGCWSFHSPLSVAAYLCWFLPHFSSSPFSSPFTPSQTQPAASPAYTSSNLVVSRPTPSLSILYPHTAHSMPSWTSTRLFPKTDPVWLCLSLESQPLPSSVALPQSMSYM